MPSTKPVNQRPKYNFESDSQRYGTSACRVGACQSKTKIQFWERFTTNGGW